MVRVRKGWRRKKKKKGRGHTYSTRGCRPRMDRVWKERRKRREEKTQGFRTRGL